MTEQNIDLNPAEFDLTDWLIGGTSHRATKTVTIYRDAQLAEAIEAHQARQQANQDSLGETTDYEADKALLDRIEASKAQVKVFALIDSELAEARQALGEKPAGYEYTRDMGYWYEVFARAATLNGHTLTAEQWERLHQTIGAQFALITQAYAVAARPDVTPRFRR